MTRRLAATFVRQPRVKADVSLPCKAELIERRLLGRRRHDRIVHQKRQ